MEADATTWTIDDASRRDGAPPNPCDGKDDGDSVGCGWVVNADGRTVPSPQICRGGQVTGSWGCDDWAYCGLDGTTYRCIPKGCNPATDRAYCTPGQGLVYCNGGAWDVTGCDWLFRNQLCNPAGTGPGDACVTVIACDPATFIPSCAPTHDNRFVCVNGQYTVQGCPDGTSCSAGACYGPLDPEQPCRDDRGDPRPPICQGTDSRGYCNSAGKWVVDKCGGQAECQYDSGGVPRCVSRQLVGDPTATL
jgi:hypothetical protein